jgi:hypothetical protein
MSDSSIPALKCDKFAFYSNDGGGGWYCHNSFHTSTSISTLIHGGTHLAYPQVNQSTHRPSRISILPFLRTSLIKKACVLILQALEWSLGIASGPGLGLGFRVRVGFRVGVGRLGIGIGIGIGPGLVLGLGIAPPTPQCLMWCIEEFQKQTPNFGSNLAYCLHQWLSWAARGNWNHKFWICSPSPGPAMG